MKALAFALALTVSSVAFGQVNESATSIENLSANSNIIFTKDLYITANTTYLNIPGTKCGFSYDSSPNARAVRTGKSLVVTSIVYLGAGFSDIKTNNPKMAIRCEQSVNGVRYNTIAELRSGLGAIGAQLNLAAPTDF